MDSLQGMLVAGQASPAFSLFLCTLLSLLSMLHFLCVLQAQTGLLSSFWYLSCLVQSWLKYLSCHWIMFLRPNQWTLWEGLKQFHLAVLLPFLYLLSGERLPCYFCLVLPYNEDKESDKRVRKGKKVSLEGREQLFFCYPKALVSPHWTSPENLFKLRSDCQDSLEGNSLTYHTLLCLTELPVHASFAGNWTLGLGHILEL